MSSNTSNPSEHSTTRRTGPSLTGKFWEFPEPNEPLINAILRRVEVSEILARLLTLRISSAEEAYTFLHPTLKSSLPDPSVLKDMDRAVARVVQAITAQEPMLIWGDYDVDGITSTALLLRFFACLGCSVPFYIPMRAHGYGPTQTALEEMLSQKTPPRVVLMVDCGVTAYETLQFMKDRNIDVVVLDHHMPEETLPSPYALVDTYLPENPESLRKICAAGLVFLFLVGLNRALRTAIQNYQEPNLLLFLDLVALGTVCDVMPLTGLNRAYVAQGLKVLEQQKTMGLREVMRLSGIHRPITTYHLAFVFGPRLNAPGRLEDATPSIHLLTAQTKKEAAFWASELERLNQERRSLEESVSAKAMAFAEAQKDKPFLVVYGDKWSTGVLGIIAGRIRERFDKPCCIISFDETGFGRGSGRSVPGVDLGVLIHRAKAMGLLEEGGGHTLAAGFSISRSQFADFEAFLVNETQNIVRPTSPIIIESILGLSAVTPELVTSLNQLGPFGAGNLAPRFLFSNVYVEHTRIVGKNHISCTLSQNDGVRIPGIAFRSVETSLETVLFARDGLYDIVGTLEINTWQGKTAAQIHIEDMGKG
ncbi:MAG: single-stranded-DNA-specific exonuclease RecJ [Holosporales bacterium]|nr:single-stranded-DNA-specific exonuclease RecJ [Holosporales bacterium]